MQSGGGVLGFDGMLVDGFYTGFPQGVDGVLSSICLCYVFRVWG